jgi:pimeloyl-ACP methyl ester carboxylesterase
MTLHFTRTGTPDAPALIFLHGLAMGDWMWHEQIVHFADYDCYVVDLPGHGGSRATPWRSFPDTAAEVAEFIAQHVPGKPVFLVGMSLGAIVGVYLLTRADAGVTRAVLSGAIAETPPRWIIAMQTRLLSALLPTGFGRRLFARMLHLPTEAMPHYLASIDALSLPDFQEISHQLAVLTPPEGLARITAPTLFVTGAQDIAINRRGTADYARQVPGASGVYAPDVHHGWNGEDPALFNAMTRAWIERAPLPARLIPA